jgi:hypothetical protein
MCVDEYGPFEVHATVSREDEVQIIHPERQGGQGATARGEVNTRRPRDYFVYLDVGQWGGRNHNFGLVYGDGNYSEILLCDYRHDGGQREVQSYFDVVTNLLNYQEMRGRVGVLRRLLYSGLHLNTQGKLYILLGDLHLPLLTEYQSVSDGAAISQRIEDAQWGIADWTLPLRNVRSLTTARVAGYAGQVFSGPGYVATLTVQAVIGALTRISAERWRELYIAGDIFAGAGYQLHCFLELLERFRTRFYQWMVPTMHLVQVGDMYDFWIGLNRLFRASPHHEVRFNDAGSGAETVRGWIRRANETNTFRTFAQSRVCLPERLHNCNLDDKTWLYGNHESYFRAMGRNPAPGVPGRRVNFYENDILMEHGHAADPYNRDGADRGHAITQLVFLRGWARSVDPDRRDDFLRLGVLRYARNRREGHPVKLFVMAHTHQPYAAPVYVGGPGVSPPPARPTLGPGPIELPADFPSQD